jgi:type IV pilus assembly protein PilA
LTEIYTLEDKMFSSLIKRMNERRAAEFEVEGTADAGFTLIELMVVLLILAILLAIAIPTFLGVTKGANNEAAQSNLKTAFTTAKTVYEQNNQTYTPVAPATSLANAMQLSEPSLPISQTTTAGTGQVAALASSDGNAAVIVAYSQPTNECWWIADVTSTETTTTNPPYTAAVSPQSASANGKALSPTIPATTVAGVPAVAGTWYGVFATATATGCNTTAVGTATSNISNTAFPTAF